MTESLDRKYFGRPDGIQIIVSMLAKCNRRNGQQILAPQSNKWKSAGDIRVGATKTQRV